MSYFCYKDYCIFQQRMHNIKGNPVELANSQEETIEGYNFFFGWLYYLYRFFLEIVKMKESVKL